MTTNYRQLNDPAGDLIAIPTATASVDIQVGGFPEELNADLVIGAANSVSSASYAFVSADIGKLLIITDGTNFAPGVYYVASVSGGAATLSASPGSQGATGGTGAFATDCRGLLILGTGDVALSSVHRPNIKATLPSVPVGVLPIRPAKVYKASNGTTATSVWGLF